MTAPAATEAPERPLTALPTAKQRARSRIAGEDPIVSWSLSIAVAVMAFLMRLWHLGTPRAFAFDETYYAKDAYALLHWGYTRRYVENADDLFLAGKTHHLFTDPYASMEVHPELGKWLIALGEKAFGMEPFGWRIASAVVGSVMILVMVRLARRLTGSTLLGCVGGLLLSFDGMQFVLSRLALLDIFVAFFVLLAVACVVADRDWHRARMARYVDTAGSWGPVRKLLWRPWLAAAGVSFGLAAGCKWTAIYPLAAFGLLVLAWDSGARRSFGVRWPFLKAAVVDGLPAFVHLVVIGFVVYVLTWTAWLLHAGEYEFELSATQYTHHNGGQNWPTRTEPDAHGFFPELGQSLRSLAHYHRDVYIFHTTGLNDSEHTYQSQPSGWLLLNRPVGVDAQTDIKPGTQGCTAPKGSDCLRQVLLLGTPALWWGSCLALMAAFVIWLGRRDWRFGVPVVGTLSTWLPWLQYDDRPIFIFYAIVTLPFMVLASTLVMGRLIGPSRSPTPRRTLGVVISGAFFVLVLANFAWFWPIWTDQLLTHSQWLQRVWFHRWI